MKPVKSEPIIVPATTEEHLRVAIIGVTDKMVPLAVESLAQKTGAIDYRASFIAVAKAGRDTILRAIPCLSVGEAKREAGKLDKIFSGTPGYIGSGVSVPVHELPDTDPRRVWVYWIDAKPVGDSVIQYKARQVDLSEKYLTSEEKEKSELQKATTAARRADFMSRTSPLERIRIKAAREAEELQKKADRELAKVRLAALRAKNARETEEYIAKQKAMFDAEDNRVPQSQSELMGSEI